jgi:hypothetical protein
MMPGTLESKPNSVWKYVRWLDVLLADQLSELICKSQRRLQAQLAVRNMSQNFGQPRILVTRRHDYGVIDGTERLLIFQVLGPSRHQHYQ